MSSAYCFKNGFTLISDTHDVAPSADLHVLAELPTAEPVHGSIWYEGTASVHSVHSAVETKAKRRPCLSVQELVMANVGNKCALLVCTTQHVAPTWMSGTLMECPHFEDTDALPGQARLRFASFCWFRLEGSSDNVSLPYDSILQIRGAPAVQYEERCDSKGLVLRLNPQPHATQLRVSMLTGGFTWAPSYKITLFDQKLSLSAHACVLNDSVSMREFKQLRLLAGVPNLAFSHVTDPLAQLSQVDNFLASLGSENNSSGYGVAGNYRPQRINMMSNVMSQQMMQPYGGGGGGGGGGEADASSQNVDDLHIYAFDNVALPKGSRTVLDLFPAVHNVHYCDIHEAELSLGTNKANATDVDVWHSIKLKNEAAAPLTTGPVLITKGAEQSLVCQSTVTFTPCGMDVQIKLTKALSVTCTHDENMQPSKNVTQRILDYEYLRFDMAGSLIVRNLKSVDVTVVVKVTMVGNLVTSSLAPSKNVETSSNDFSNTTRTLTFEVQLGAKKTECIKYVRSYWRRN